MPTDSASRRTPTGQQIGSPNVYFTRGVGVVAEVNLDVFRRLADRYEEGDPVGDACRTVLRNASED